MYGVPDFYQNDNVKKGTGMQWRHQVVSDLPSSDNDRRAIDGFCIINIRYK